LCVKGHQEKCVREACLLRLAFHAKAEDFSTEISKILGESETDNPSNWSHDRIEEEKQKLNNIEEWFNEVDRKIESGEWVLKTDTTQ